MKKRAAVDILKLNAEAIRRLGVERVYLFGSTGRDAARADSDVDLFIDYADPQFSLIDLARVRRVLSAVLGVEADVTTRGGLHPLLKDEIERTADRVV